MRHLTPNMSESNRKTLMSVLRRESNTLMAVIDEILDDESGHTNDTNTITQNDNLSVIQNQMIEGNENPEESMDDILDISDICNASFMESLTEDDLSLISFAEKLQYTDPDEIVAEAEEEPMDESIAVYEEEETQQKPQIVMEESVAAIKEEFVAVIQEAQPKVSTSKAKVNSKQCPICNLVFSTTSNRVRHVSVKHHQTKPYICKYCSKSFSQSFNSSRHEDSCGNRKSFNCQICNKTFTNKKLFNQHKKQH